MTKDNLSLKGRAKILGIHPRGITARIKVCQRTVPCHKVNPVKNLHKYFLRRF